MFYPNLKNDYRSLIKITTKEVEIKELQDRKEKHDQKELFKIS